MGIIYIFRKLSESKSLEVYKSDSHVPLYKQFLTVLLVILVLVNMLVINKSFDEIQFVRLMFTGIIIIDGLFLLLAILHDQGFLAIAFESALIIALVFARFPLFASNSLSYMLSVLGAAFATGSLYILYKVLSEVGDRALKEDHGGHHG